MTKKIRFYIPSILSTFFLLCSICLAQERGKVVFERMGPDGKKLQVLIRATRRVPTAQEKANVEEYNKKNSPRSTRIMTNLVYHYELRVSSLKETKELWSFDRGGFGGEEQLKADTFDSTRTPIHFLDVHVEEDVIIAVTKQGIIQLGAMICYTFAKVGDKQFTSDPNRLLAKENHAAGFAVASGRIEGTLKDKTLKVILDYTNGAKDEIAWRNDEWIKTWDGFEKAREARVTREEEEELRRAESIRAEEARKRDPKYQYEQQWVYHEDLPYSRYEGTGLSVVRRREKIEPLSRVSEFLQTLPPDARLTQPKRVDIIDFRYSAIFPHPITELESDRRLLWTRRIENFTNEDAPDLTVLDMDYDRITDVMTVVFRENGVLRADIVRDDPQRGRIAMPLADTRLDGKDIEKAVITGSDTEKTLTITGTSADGRTMSWLLKESKWHKTN